MGANFISTKELSRTFGNILPACLITGSFSSYRNALLFGMGTYWGLLGTDYTSEPAASEAAFTLADLLSAGDKEPAGLTLGSKNLGTTTDTSKATKETP